MAGKFELFKDNLGEYRWKYKSEGKCKIVITSEKGYVDKYDCLHTISLLMEQVPEAKLGDISDAFRYR